MKQDETRQRLIDGTIHVIARDGLDKATTKQIGTETATNEAYIYRCFDSKEDMFTKTFDALDEELLAQVMQGVEIMYMAEMPFQMRCWAFYSSVWRFILGNREKCQTYVRYYYSTYFKRYSQREHKERFMPFVNKAKIAFKEEANVWMILTHMLSTMLGFAVNVFDGEIPDNEDTAEHVFRLIYVSVQQYFADSEVKAL